MAMLDPPGNEVLAELEHELRYCEEFLGFTPNDVKTMAHSPQLVRSFCDFTRAIYAAGKVDPGLLQLVGILTSSAAGCQYCTAHMANAAPRFGVSEEKLSAVWEFEHSVLFSEPERAGLRLALHAGQSPNAVNPDDIKSILSFYTAGDAVQLMAVIILFGFLNRWNDSLATELESEPLQFAEQHLADKGWQVGKHSSS